MIWVMSPFYYGPRLQVWKLRLKEMKKPRPACQNLSS